MVKVEVKEDWSQIMGDIATIQLEKAPTDRDHVFYAKYRY